MPVQKIMTATLVGIDAALVEVEADVSNGLPTTIIVGLPGVAVQESRERVRSAIKHSGFQFPLMRVSLNLAPGNLPKSGTHFDLPIAVAILLAARQFKPKNPYILDSSVFIGELSLDGSVKSSAGLLAMVQAAKLHNFKTVFIPKESLVMASLMDGLTIVPVGSLSELIQILTTEEFSSAPNKIKVKHKRLIDRKSNYSDFDFANIAGQEQAKRALEIAASGGHNILLTGPPGSGKTMLAKALSKILPPLQLDEILELTKIYNSAGKLTSGIITERPMRTPHHTTSGVALLGGGSIPRPGEITLAHLGVLFLDEFAEFSKNVLEALRQPLEENVVTITRTRDTYTYPASFILVAAQNPCPCGNFGEPELECTCTAGAIEKYKKKISKPLLDRIDLQIQVRRVSYEKIMSPEHVRVNSSETSATIAARVVQARRVQAKRYKRIQTNSEMTLKQLKQYCRLDQHSSRLLELASNKYQLSGRGIHRVIKVARTIADLELTQDIDQKHLAEALQYRL